MKKTNCSRSFLLGMMTTLLLVGLVIPGVAASIQKTITVSSGVSIFVDGVEMKPTDVNGNPVETFIYNGTTYVPLRAVSQYLGKAVKWDGDNWSVYIGKAPGEVQSLLDVCPPYESDNYHVPSSFTMANKTYTNGFYLGTNTYKGGYILFNLDGEYTSLDFDFGHIDHTKMDDIQFTIYLDGQVCQVIEGHGEDLPKHMTIPLNRALQMKIAVTGGGWGCYGFANVEIR